jgi:hypothetical protein
VVWFTDDIPYIYDTENRLMGAAMSCARYLTAPDNPTVVLFGWPTRIVNPSSFMTVSNQRAIMSLCCWK